MIAFNFRKVHDASFADFHDVDRLNLGEHTHRAQPRNLPNSDKVDGLVSSEWQEIGRCMTPIVIAGGKYMLHARKRVVVGFAEDVAGKFDPLATIDRRKAKDDRIGIYSERVEPNR